MKLSVQAIGARKLFVLTAYILLAVGALIYGNLITLNLDFVWQNNTLVAEVPRDIDQASLYIEFRNPQTGAVPINVMSGTMPIYAGSVMLEESSDFKNYLLFRKTPKINKGSLELKFENPIDIVEVRAEYRYSAFRYYLDAFKTGDSRALTLLLGWFLVFAAGIFLWKFGLKTQLLMIVAVGHLFFLWMVFAPLSGYDDTYHLPGAALMTTQLNREEVRRETVKLIKDANYMSIRHVPRSVEKELNSKTDYCPHILSFPDLTIENCPYGEDFNLKIYSQVLKIFNLQTVSAVEIGLKVINQIVFFLAVLVLTSMFSLLFDLTWSRSFKFVLAASLSFFPLIPQSMTTGHDLLFFLISSIGLWLMIRIWQSKGHKERALCLLISFLLVAPFIIKAQDNNKTYLILVVPALAFLCFLIASKEILLASQNYRRGRELIWVALALLPVVPLGWYLCKLASPFLNTLFYFGDEKSNSLSLQMVFELSLNEVIGFVISGKIYPPSPVKALYLFLLLGLGGRGLKRFFKDDKFIAAIMLSLFLGVIAILLSLGGRTLSEVWISLRFSYALAPVFWLLFAAGFLDKEDFNTAPALVAIVAVNTIYLPAFVFPLLS